MVKQDSSSQPESSRTQGIFFVWFGFSEILKAESNHKSISDALEKRQKKKLMASSMVHDHYEI